MHNFGKGGDQFSFAQNSLTLLEQRHPSLNRFTSFGSELGPIPLFQSLSIQDPNGRDFL